jgi:S-formylglutathione hydrolase
LNGARQVIETLAVHPCFGGLQGFYRHESRAIGLPMRFAVYQPPQATRGRLPVLFYLAGLTCTEETFMIKAGAQRLAAEHGVIIVACDTSPRNTGIPGEADDWEFGSGAGFYVDATQMPWSKHFRMYDYVLNELRALVLAQFPADPARIGIFGHSMGGHGALVLALRNPGVYRSVSAFAPICAPSQCAWGLKALPRYLGEDRAAWAAYDATQLMRNRGEPVFDNILIDQGLGDGFLAQSQLLPEQFDSACAGAGQPLTLRRHAGYDHSYYFVASFVADHIAHHARALG